MENPSEPRIISSDRWDNSIVVSFDEGSTAQYSAALLYATLPHARMLSPTQFERDQILP